MDLRRNERHSMGKFKKENAMKSQSFAKCDLDRVEMDYIRDMCFKR
ncbi:hypothetical protein D515_00222 [Grimontia indica]|uniref:Uncharacterized protein n=1 Tax=Grimontia indica TaxID=1056512 RepID=R1IZJ1_9GAMM|nr:hypothetical protein D515_00222 [Grimontia indica]